MRYKRALEALRFHIQNSYWTASPVGLAGQSKLGEIFAGAGLNAQSAKQGLTTTCEVARSLCRPVDDLVGRPQRMSSYSPPMSYVPRPTYVSATDPGFLSELKSVLEQTSLE